MSATLEVKREGVGIELRRGRFDIVVDEETVGSIERDETIVAVDDLEYYRRTSRRA